jgi:hypothetical protein
LWIQIAVIPTANGLVSVTRKINGFKLKRHQSNPRRVFALLHISKQHVAKQ